MTLNLVKSVFNGRYSEIRISSETISQQSVCFSDNRCSRFNCFFYVAHQLFYNDSDYGASNGFHENYLWCIVE